MIIMCNYILNVFLFQENEKTLKKWDLIKDALSKPIRNSKELMDAILIYQSGFKDIWKFKALHKFFNEASIWLDVLF